MSKKTKNKKTSEKLPTVQNLLVKQRNDLILQLEIAQKDIEKILIRQKYCKDLRSKESNVQKQYELKFEYNNLVKIEDQKRFQIVRLDQAISDVNKKVEIEKEKKELKERLKATEEYLNSKYNKKNNEVKQTLQPIQKTVQVEDMSECEIEWSKVKFLDHSILFELKSTQNLSEPFPYKLSRKSYNHLKKFFIHRNLPPLKVKFRKRKPIEVVNLDELNSVIEILEIENFFHFDSFSISLREKQVFNISNFKFSKDQICKIYKLYGKSIFFDNLISLQHSDLKLIPVPELILGDKLQIVKSEDSFIFSFERGRSIYLVWESVIEKKATYIFLSNHQSYHYDLQRLFDFLSSPNIKNKREKLIQDRRTQSFVRLNKRILHTEPNAWVYQIRNC